MYKIFILLLAALLFAGTNGYCASRTVSFQLTVVIPPHVMLKNLATANINQSTANQLVQTDTVLRNNRQVRITSVVPT